MSQLLSKVLPNPSASVSNTAVAIRIYLVRHGETHWNKLGKIQGGGYDVPLNATGRAQAKRAAVALEGIPLDAVVSSSLSRARETADVVWEHCCHKAVTATVTATSTVAPNKTPNPLRFVDPGFNEMRFGEFEGFAFRRKPKDNDIKNDTDTNTDEVSEAKLHHFLVEKKKVANDPEYCFPSRDNSDSDSDRVEADEAYKVESVDSGSGESTRIVEERAVGALSRAIARVNANVDSNASTTTTTTATKHVAIVSHGRTNKILLASMLTGDAHAGYGKIGQGNCNISILDHPGVDGDVVGTSSWKGGWTARVLNYTDHIDRDTDTV